MVVGYHDSTVLIVRASDRSLLFVFLSSLLACASNGANQSTEPSGTAMESTASTSTKPSAQTSSTTTPSTDRCVDLGDRFREVMKQATGTCKSDADCGCFQPVVKEAGCGGITDKGTTDRLNELTREFLSSANGQKACSWPHQCGPWSCQPSCQQGRCANSTSGGLILPP